MESSVGSERRDTIPPELDDAFEKTSNDFEGNMKMKQTCPEGIEEDDSNS